jgi:hypothetical protein
MNSWLAPLQWLMFFAVWRMAYETANTGTGKPPPPSYLVQKDSQDEITGPRQREWTEKAVKGYAAAQEKKWRRWNEAMFERSD